MIINVSIYHLPMQNVRHSDNRLVTGFRVKWGEEI